MASPASAPEPMPASAPARIETAGALLSPETHFGNTVAAVRVSDDIWIFQIAFVFTAGLIAGIVCTVFAVASLSGISKLMPWTGWVGIGILGYGVAGSALVGVIAELSYSNRPEEAAKAARARV